MVNTHEGKYICGYCKKETPLEDEVLIKAVEGHELPICSCGNFSYNSSIKFKASINTKDWRYAIGSCE